MAISFTWGKVSSANGIRKRLDLLFQSMLPFLGHFPRPWNKLEENNTVFGIPGECVHFQFYRYLCVWDNIWTYWAMLAGLYKSRCCVNHFGLLTSKRGRQAEQCHSLPGIWQKRDNKCSFDICSCSFFL